MQNYPVGYAPQIKYTQQPPQQAAYQYAPQPQAQTQVQTNTPPVAVQAAGATGATFNIGTNTPGAIPVNGANGVTINILGATVTPNGANINNTYNGIPGQAYDKNYYTMPPQQQVPTVPVASTPITNNQNNDANKTQAKKDIVLLTDDYIRTLENYIRNDNPEIKLMGAKELMNRFKEDKSRKNDPALTALLNLTLQSKYSNVKMVGLGILQNGWAQGDTLTQQLLAQIQQTKGGYGLDALDAAKAALKTAGQTVQVNDPNPPKAKETKSK